MSNKDESISKIFPLKTNHTFIIFCLIKYYWKKHNKLQIFAK